MKYRKAAALYGWLLLAIAVVQAQPAHSTDLAHGTDKEVVDVADDTALSELLATATRPVAVMFVSDYCDSARQLNVQLPVIAQQFGDQVDFVRCDVKKVPAVIARYDIKAFPTVLLFRNGQQEAMDRGFQSSDKTVAWLKNELVHPGGDAESVGYVSAVEETCSDQDRSKSCTSGTKGDTTRPSNRADKSDGASISELLDKYTTLGVWIGAPMGVSGRRSGHPSASIWNLFNRWSGGWS